MRHTRAISALALVAGFGLLAVACGDDDGGSTAAPTAGDSTGGASTTAADSTQMPSDADPNGVLNLPINLAAMPSFDPAKPTPPSPATQAELMVYGTLLRSAGLDGSVEPGLAKEVKFV